MPIRNITALSAPPGRRRQSTPGACAVPPAQASAPRDSKHFFGLTLTTSWLSPPKSRRGALLLRFAGLALYTLLLIGGTSLLTNQIAAAVAPESAPEPSLQTQAPATPVPSPTPTAHATPVSIPAPPSTSVPAPVVPPPAPPSTPPAPPAPPAPPVPAAPAPSSKTEIAVQFALRQLGLRYVWGGTGPSGFDCSGLTMRAYQAAGIKLPRTAAQQSRVGTRVRVAQRGDLVISNGLGHVSIALGDGNVIEAPRPGKKISITRMPRKVTAIVRVA